MARYTICNKRADILKEWLLALYANNESYYWATVTSGVPDGTDLEELLEDLMVGEYDYCIDDTLKMFKNVREKYAHFGWYFQDEHKTIFDIEKAVRNIESKIGELPTKIYRKSGYNIYDLR